MQDFVPKINNHMIKKKKEKKEKKKRKRYKDSHAPRPLFTSRLKYLPLLANINLRVWCNDPTLVEINYATGNKRLTYSSSS